MDNNIGKKLDGRYELLELIGVGGMADIYRARDIQEDRIVAVKILKTEFAGSEEFLRRFRNESKAIALLSHPNIVKIYDVGFTDKVQFIVMEYVDGITLTDYIEQQGVLKWRGAFYRAGAEGSSARSRQGYCSSRRKELQYHAAARWHYKGHGFWYRAL